MVIGNLAKITQLAHRHVRNQIILLESILLDKKFLQRIEGAAV
jgi:hypothetical protein